MHAASVVDVYLGGSDETKEGEWVWVGRKAHSMTKDVDITGGVHANKWRFGTISNI